MRSARNVALVVLAILFAGCATLSNTAAWSEKSPKEKSLYFMQVYNQQYEDTMFMARNPQITEAQKAAVRVKKKVLMQAWPAIKIYDSVAAGGGVPTAEQEQVILNFINQLVTMTI